MKIRSLPVLLLVVALASCPSKAPVTKGGVQLKFPRGGVVRAAIVSDTIGQSGPGDPAMDPSREYVGEAFELFRCCLLRTLYQYSGQLTNEGGADLRPDLANGPPSVSSDGLTWTIRIRSGIRYAPPLQQQEIVAGDFVTALKRVARVTDQDFGDYAVYYSIIQGFDAYAKGKADTISGVATPDPHTLVFTLIARAGDFADRFSMAATAPIPTLASAGGAFGVATGHDAGYGRYLIASGPYMLEGSEALTPGAPVDQQKPAGGFLPGAKVMRLVRNPSWDPTTDDLRPAYPDRIDVQLVPSVPDMQNAVDRGTVDVMMYGGPPIELDLGQYHRYQADPSLGHTYVFQRDSTRYATMNIAVPPFDDVHVRRAANFVVNKQAYIDIFGGPLAGSPPTHIALDSLEENQLVNYNPYRASSPGEGLDLAKQEMRSSKYDTNHDGVCDAKVCKDVVALAFPVERPNVIKAARSVAHDLGLIGIRVRVEAVDGETFFQKITEAKAKIPLGLAPAWSHDFLNASNFVTPLFASSEVSSAFTVPGGSPGQCCNYSLVGASASSLRGWGYGVTQVPSVDSRINECLRLVGRPQLQCWTALDQYLTQVIVPWIPLILENAITMVPARVKSISFDQFTSLPSLDRVVVEPVPSPSAS
ncbi:MAG: ABC transporter substrate-binding protein [Actinomycetota bacterium]